MKSLQESILSQMGMGEASPVIISEMYPFLIFKKLVNGLKEGRPGIESVNEAEGTYIFRPARGGHTVEKNATRYTIKFSGDVTRKYRRILKGIEGNTELAKHVFRDGDGLMDTTAQKFFVSIYNAYSKATKTISITIDSAFHAKYLQEFDDVWDTVVRP